jgi:catechol 2,3-dioxygenase-like lactoylglutathione lyase family enzyme
MIRGVHTMFYTSEPEALRAFFRDKLGFPCSDVGEGWLIFDLPEADLGCHPVEKETTSVPSGTPGARQLRHSAVSAAVQEGEQVRSAV